MGKILKITTVQNIPSACTQQRLIEKSIRPGNKEKTITIYFCYFERRIRSFSISISPSQPQKCRVTRGSQKSSKASCRLRETEIE